MDKQEELKGWTYVWSRSIEKDGKGKGGGGRKDHLKENVSSIRYKPEENLKATSTNYFKINWSSSNWFLSVIGNSKLDLNKTVLSWCAIVGFSRLKCHISVTQSPKYTQLKRITNQFSFVYNVVKSLYILKCLLSHKSS